MFSSKCTNLLLLIPLLFNLMGCTPHVVNLQEIEIVGASLKNPIKIVNDKKKGGIDFNLNFSINNKDRFYGNIKGHSKVNNNNIYEIEKVDNEDYYLEYKGKNEHEFEGDNFSWKIPKLNGSADIDIIFSQNFAFTFGSKLSSYDNYDYWGHNIGVAYFREFETWAYRFDTFLKYQQIKYEINYLKAEDISWDDTDFREVYLFNKRNTDDNYNLAFMFSLNSKNHKWPINCFANYAFGYQTLYNFSLGSIFNSDRVDEFNQDEYYHSLSFGFYQAMFNFSNIIIGYTFTSYSHSGKNFAIPSAFVQFDFALL